MPTVAIIGASSNRRKFGNISIRAHRQAGYVVYPVHPTETTIESLKVYRAVTDIPEERLDRVSMYVPPHIGKTLLEEIAAKQPAEVWFNPGSADNQLLSAALALGLNVIHACSIVNLGISPGDVE